MITIQEQIKAVGREIALRRNVYPGLVARGRLSQEKAQAEIAVMEAVLETLKGLLDTASTNPPPAVPANRSNKEH